MMTQPSPEVQQRLRALCAQMSATQNLDGEVQRELYGHMEDKLLAYLNGEEPVTEEDALVLVREHFGDPATVKGLLRAAHPMAAAHHFLRRVAAIMCAGTLCLLLTGLLVKTVLPYLPSLTSDPVGTVFLYMAVPPLTNLAALYLLWCTLRFWQRQMDQGHPVWFMDYPARLVAGIGVGVFFFGLLFGAGHLMAAPLLVPQLRPDASAYPLLLQLVYAACSGLLWMGWCDRPPRLQSSLLAAYGVWATFELLLTLTPQAPIWWSILRGTGPAPQFQTDMLRYFMAGPIILCAAGICAMAIHTGLQRGAQQKPMKGDVS